MRIWLLLFIVAAFPALTLAQASPLPWPEIAMTNCPKLAAPVDPSQRTWKYGPSEQTEYNSIRQMLGAKNYSGAADRAAKFADTFPGSDYRDGMLLAEITAQGYLKNWNGEIRPAEALVRSPIAEPAARVAGFATLVGLAPKVLSNDPEKERKLADLEKWTQCGREAFAQMKWGPGEALDKARRAIEAMFERTDGFVALMHQNFQLADSKLERAKQLDPEHPLTYILLFQTKFSSSPSDLAGGTFYLAKWAELEPDMPTSSDFLKRTYVMVHGSDKGLSDLRALAKANAAPPPGFSIQPPPAKKEHHYAIAAAATAILGLLVYEAVKCPGCFTNASGDSAPTNAAGQKVMIFGGPGHHTYLGCLSCGELATDSVFNKVGEHGSAIYPDSIWNRVGDYGSQISPSSVCNPIATDTPVIVDEAGNAYGRLTVNAYNPYIGAGRQFYGWLSSEVCHR
jgi:hypothetical protein